MNLPGVTYPIGVKIRWWSSCLPVIHPCVLFVFMWHPVSSQELITVARTEKLFMNQRQWEGGDIGGLCLDANEKRSNFEKQQFVLQFFLGFLKTKHLSCKQALINKVVPSVSLFSLYCIWYLAQNIMNPKSLFAVANNEKELRAFKFFFLGVCVWMPVFWLDRTWLKRHVIIKHEFTNYFLPAPPIVPSCEMLHSTAPSVWTSTSLTNMSSSDFVNCLELLGQDPFLPSYHRSQLLQKVKKVRLSVFRSNL